MSHARVNPFVQPGRVPRPPDPAVLEFHRGLPGYAPTPLHACSSLAARLGIGTLHVKDEGLRFGLGAFKALGASWAIERLRRRQPAPRTVCAATAGNHGRAVAWAARRLGLEAVIYLPAGSAPARVEAIRREGARVVLVAEGYDAAVDRCARESAREGWQVVSDMGYEGYLEVPRWIADGYRTLFLEIDAQLAGAEAAPPNLVVVQAGVGSLLHAAVDHWRDLPAPPVLVCVEPDGADPLRTSIDSPDGTPTPAAGPFTTVMAGLNCARVSLAAWPAIRRGVELFLTIPDRCAEEAMRRLWQPAGEDARLVSGESGAAGLGALIALRELPELAAAAGFLRLGADTRALAIVTEGATDPAGFARVVGEAPPIR